MTAVANFIGPFIFGVAVAETIGHEIVVARGDQHCSVLLAALASAIVWNLLTWIPGFPEQFLARPDRRLHRCGRHRRGLAAPSSSRA
ncbi:MAG: inorganic phosphate transporter [Candidatus Moduliflexus flocculans]|nr:inorganic phosphate transporter [Candidatus Moduliflexus flocculans]